MATTSIRSYHEEALYHAGEAERILKSTNEMFASQWLQTQASLAQVHATLALAYSQIEDQS